MCHSNTIRVVIKKLVPSEDCASRGIKAQDPDNGAPILAKFGDFESYEATDCPREILHPGVTREWVGEGKLPKERT
ncbi:hypothetical protein B296_00016182 [Ensete ventricosum]|uniref:Uncharacterized protein n=1 Tax=Ensete ventricosum TaxID=4639 RepID=A0A426ZI50_ENSVE|nr:hypothetical protein B296_00016182 [Ensete ventricosum]